MEYSRNLKVENIVYYRAYWDYDPVAPFVGCGIRKAVASNAVLSAPSNDWANVDIGGGSYNSANEYNKSATDNPSEYCQHLWDAGLHPYQGAYPKHNVDIATARKQTLQASTGPPISRLSIRPTTA